MLKVTSVRSKTQVRCSTGKEIEQGSSTPPSFLEYGHRDSNNWSTLLFLMAIESGLPPL